jgi:hypothetical protein
MVVKSHRVHRSFTPPFDSWASMNTMRQRTATLAACVGFAVAAMATSGAAAERDDASSASAGPVPGASYEGQAADGATVDFTVSSDGTLVDSYRIKGAHGTYAGESDAVTCYFVGEGDPGTWEGAPIVTNAFSYTAGNDSFQGTFNGAQTATGSFRFYQAADSSSPSCDTGTVTWTATTTSPPPSTGTGTSTGGGSGPGTGTGTGTSTGTGSGTQTTTTSTGKKPTAKAKPRYTTRVVFGKLAHGKLGGTLKSSGKMCRATRTVTLWLGPKPFASTRSKANGSYAFTLKKPERGRHVRAAVKTTTLKSAVCTASTSKFITA